MTIHKAIWIHSSIYNMYQQFKHTSFHIFISFMPCYYQWLETGLMESILKIHIWHSYSNNTKPLHACYRNLKIITLHYLCYSTQYITVHPLSSKRISSYLPRFQPTKTECHLLSVRHGCLYTGNHKAYGCDINRHTQMLKSQLKMELGQQFLNTEKKVKRPFYCWKLTSVTVWPIHAHKPF